MTQSGYQSLTSFVPTLNNGQTFIATLDNPFPNGFTQPVGAAGGLYTYLGQGASFTLPQLDEPYTQRWTFNIQHMLPQQILLDVGYMGSRSVRLFVSEQLDPTPAQYLSTLPTRDQPSITLLGEQVPSPFYGIPQFHGTGLAATTTSLAQLLTPYPQFTGIADTSNAGSASYNALVARVERRFAHGWTSQLSYTYSKFMENDFRLNPTDLKPAHEISPYDRTQWLTINGTYELPFGRGKPLLSHGGWSNVLFGGWSIVGLYIGASGVPVGPWGDIIFTGNLKDIPLPSSERTPAHWFNAAAGFNTNPSQQLADNIRTFPKYLSGVRAKGDNNINLSGYKAFTIRENLHMIIYYTMEDITNNEPWGQPNVTPSSSAFGEVNSMQPDTVGRRGTVGLRIKW